LQSGPKWFPDNRSLLILVNDPQGSARTFYRLHVDSGNADPLYRVEKPISMSSFTLSPDGNSIFWVLQNSSDDYWPSGRLMRFDISTGRETTLKSDEWFITVAVSPDGKQLAYLKSIRRVEGQQNATVIDVMSTSGGDAREVFRDPLGFASGSRYNTLAWTSDGRYILFVKNDGVLRSVSVDGGEVTDTGISSKFRIKMPSVRPDGRRIVFATVEGDNNEIWSLEHFLPTTLGK
jgi:Tol biopolymer transport system component